MSLDACAALVERGDPDRFAAVLAAPRAARAPLLVLYAFNLEVARAPWASAEPLVAQMRLQWWRDTLAAVASGAARAHDVAGPLHDLIRDRALPVDVADRLVAARLPDCWGEAPADEDALAAYLDDTGGGLMWLAARALGAPAAAEGVARDLGRALGAANLLRASAELAARGRPMLPDPSVGGVRRLARQGQGWLAAARPARAALGPGRPAAPAARAAAPPLAPGPPH
ncbi:MAG TPA: squalene/phytoene synthase family protein, partial [Paracoccaceae bacterium]|nr:squalene/phytoene synthase family protein [Paracoccaceae bacterium]